MMDPRIVVKALISDLDTVDTGRVVYLIPSTRASTSQVKLMVSEARGRCLVGCLTASSIAPIDLLACIRTNPRVFPIIFSFPDQQVDPGVATIYSDDDGRQEFFSGLEPVLHANYGYALKLVENGKIVSTPAAGTIGAGIKMLKRYFEQADKLGEDWLFRSRQIERTLAWRAREAKLRVRYLQSAIYHRYADQRLDEEGREVLNKLAAVSRRLIEVRR